MTQAVPPASHTSPEPTRTQHTSLVPSLGLSGAWVSPSFLSCSRSFCPQGTLATFATTVQLPRFGSPFILSLRSSRGPGQALLTFPSLWSVPSRGSHLPPDCQPTFRSQPASSPCHTCLPFPALSLVILLPLLCDFWSLNMNFQRWGGIRPGSCSSGREPSASLLVFLEFFPLGLLSFPSGRGFWN